MNFHPDIICTNCGELWAVDYILHEAGPGEFERQGALISRCPCCDLPRPIPLREQDRKQLAGFAALAVRFGDDLDAFAGFLEKMELLDPYR